MSCYYTAQGMFVCEKKKPAVEHFVVREDPNEKSTTDWCSPINNAFLDIAKRNICDIKADVSTCQFNFSCKKPSQ